jgi:hypothetical protein
MDAKCDTVEICVVLCKKVGTHRFEIEVIWGVFLLCPKVNTQISKRCWTIPDKTYGSIATWFYIFVSRGPISSASLSPVDISRRPMQCTARFSRRAESTHRNPPSAPHRTYPRSRARAISKPYRPRLPRRSRSRSGRPGNRRTHVQHRRASHK